MLDIYVTALHIQHMKTNDATKNTKTINGCQVRKNKEHKGMWDVLETKAGQVTGRVSFTGTISEIRQATSN